MTCLLGDKGVFFIIPLEDFDGTSTDNTWFLPCHLNSVFTDFRGRWHDWHPPGEWPAQKPWGTNQATWRSGASWGSRRVREDRGERGLQSQKHWASHIQHTPGGRVFNLLESSSRYKLICEMLWYFKNPTCLLTTADSQSMFPTSNWLYVPIKTIVVSLTFSVYSLFPFFGKPPFILHKEITEESSNPWAIFLWTLHFLPLKCILGNIFICKAFNLHSPGRHRTLFSSWWSHWSSVKLVFEEPS